MTRPLFRAALAAALTALAACGGGSGGGGGGGGGGQSGVGDGLTVTPAAIGFAAVRSAPVPNSQVVSITLTRDDITNLVGGYVPGSPFPSWFYVDTPVGAGRYWTIRLHIASTLLGPGTYTTTLRIAATVGSTVVGWRDVQVSFVVRAFGVTPTALPATKVLGSSYGAAMPYPDVEVDAPTGTAWTASTSDEWVTLARTTGTGSYGGIRVNVDASTKPLGTYLATATFSSALGTDTATVTLTVSPPKLTVLDPDGATTLVLSGASGHDLTTKTLQVSLDTGTNAHPWTASTAYDWIELVTTSGSASMTPGALKVRASAAAAAWPVGTYSGTIELRATIEAGTARETVVTKTVPVRLTLDDLRILVDRQGVGLVSMPGYSSLTRSLRVRTNRGVAESWIATATSDGNWLGVASDHGTTADPLVLTADPTGLATDTVHVGTVTVSSPDVGNVETVRVGLWVGSVDPAAVASVAFTQWNTDDPSLVADPVAPHVYVHGHQPSEIEIWNVHTRTKVGTIQVPNADLGSMTVSGDGRRLFAVDRAPTPRRVVPIDLDPVSVGSAWTIPQLNGPRILWTRANGVPVLLAVAANNPGSAHDPETGTAWSGATFATSTTSETILAASADGTRFCALETPLLVTGAGLDLECHLLDASISGGTTRSVVVGPNRLPPSGYGYGYGFDVALSADGARVYVAATSATSLHVFDVDVSGDGALKDAGILATGASPRAVQVGQDGRIYCGTAGTGGPSALVFAPGGGAAQSTYALGIGSVIAPFLAVSADGHQVVTLTAPDNGAYNATRMTTVSVQP